MPKHSNPLADEIVIVHTFEPNLIKMPKPTNPLADEILNQKYKVLDRGFVALIDYMGNDRAIEDAARISYAAPPRKKSETRDLIRYLYRHGHTGPFEMAELKFHCRMPIFVARQWIRHRTASVNELSGRYSVLPIDFYQPSDSRYREQSKSNKQGSGETLSQELIDEAKRRMREARVDVADNYDWMIANDMAHELARIDLPLSTYTEWIWKIDLRNLLHFLMLRCDKHAQQEIRDYAQVIASIVRIVFPLVFEAWVDYDLQSMRLSRLELAALKRVISEGIAHTELETFGLSAREIGELKDKFCGDKLFDYPLTHRVITKKDIDEACIAIDFDSPIFQNHGDLLERTKRQKPLENK